MIRTSCFLFLLVTIVVAEGPWFPMRLEYSSSGNNEMGISSGLWWSRNIDNIPLDAYGPVLGVKALVHDNRFIPGINVGLEANALFLCARMLCDVYVHRHDEALALLTPQVGLTWLSLINLYVGYNQKIYGSPSDAVNEVNLSLCVNLPSYFFGTIGD